MQPIDRDPLHLHPRVRELYHALQEEVEDRGIPGKLFEGFRSWDRQAELYAQGRTRPGMIITHAKPGWSIHNYGLAIDLVMVIDGKWSWNAEIEIWEDMGRIGSQLGFEWGGHWARFSDRPHFQWTGGLTLKDLQASQFPPPEEQAWLSFMRGEVTARQDRDIKIQQILQALGYYDGAIDGIIGPRSQRAIREFQAACKLEIDGIIGPITWDALLVKAKDSGIDV